MRTYYLRLYTKENYINIFIEKLLNKETIKHYQNADKKKAK